MFRGIVLPLVIVAYGLYCYTSGHGYIIGEGMGFGNVLRVTGSLATALAISCFGLGATLHFHYFWRERQFGWRFAPLGEILGLLTWLVSLGYIIWGVFVK